MADEVVIDRRFRGPPDSANGGYACGVVAAFLDPAPAVEVTLRAPPPIGRPLTIEVADDAARMRDGEALVAEGRPASLPDLELPEPIGIEEAEVARRAGRARRDEHAYPMCFVCGPDRESDGLRVICGPVPGREELVAAPFDTEESMAGDDGAIRSELVWSVLDCPSGIAAILVPDFGVSVLGRLTGELRRPLEAGRSYVAIGWPVERDGRKLRSATAILDESGEALAVANAIWIELK